MSSADYITTIHFRRLHGYVRAGLITKGQLNSIEAHYIKRNEQLSRRNHRKLLRQEEERKSIIAALAQHGNHREDTALALSMSVRSLYRKISQYNIQ